ncbi:ATP-dependent DNA ligase [Arthrobacter sulfonylureivorans]|uniref:ATP-dependent DNA ligase n=1 Tax=Arthrobacter sulfonylureivorans TaxID=2486855 RepID=A0ABY3WF38_9MICC|nr:ATP-dependent DNA ligase [Arthrobacter sulfonylureivorans]UNK47840.1 ATP-dependent DNA ligase [Arthrobacter sulfonylureivorans]
MNSRLPEGLRPPVKVALARAVEKVPSPSALPGGAWYEPKWDGYRAVISRDGEETSLWSRQGKNLSKYFPDLIKAAADQLPPGCLLDGETVIWSEDRLDFSALQQRLSTSVKSMPGLVRKVPAHFVAFDLLAIAGHDLRGEAFRVRRRLLEELAKDWTGGLELSPGTSDPDTAATWLEELPAAGIEGLVIKGAGQPYEGGRRQWQKIKHRDTVDVICAAVIGPLTRPEAIVAGLPIEGELRIVGRSAPLKPAASKLLGSQLQAAGPDHPWPHRVKSTLMDRFNADAGETELTLVEPLVVEVSADTAMSGASFRHAVRFLRARPELDPESLNPHGMRVRPETE